MVDLPDLDVSGAGQGRDEVVTMLADLVMNRDALRFGKFQLRANKFSPYTIDTHLLCRGRDTFTISNAIAKTVQEAFSEGVEILVGAPGIGGVLAAMGAFYYGHIANFNVEWCLAQLGSKGEMVLAGAPIREGARVCIVDDMLVGGEQIRELIALLKEQGCVVVGAVALLDRRERTKSNRVAANDIERDTGVKVVSCATVPELVKKMPVGFLPDDKRELITKHVTIEGGPLPPRFTP